MMRNKKANFSTDFLKIELWGFPGGSVVKNLPSVQETQETQI